MEKCPLCDTRRPRRNCPALGKEICPQCCGSKREESIDCPLECPYLIEGREHEELVPVLKFPHEGVTINNAFLDRNQPLYLFVLGTLHNAAKETPGAMDADIREAIGALLEKCRARQSGLVYDAAIPNRFAASIVASFEKHLEEFRAKVQAENVDPVQFIDANMFKLLVFVDRFALVKNNGRAKGRHFLSLLRLMFPPPRPKSEAAAG